MRKLALVAVACLGAAACTEITTSSVAGGTAGAVAGAAVAGPVGAVVGGTVGATAGVAAGTVGAVTSPGVCQATDRSGRPLYDRGGRAVMVRC